MNDFDPSLFLNAQDRVWDRVVAELSAGRKTSHWMWYVFPQLASLGHSPTAQLYGLRDMSQATAYLAHPRLRARLEQAAGLILRHRNKPATTILGPVDALKLRSSMTLFAAVPGAPSVFADVLAAFYDGIPCPLTETALIRD